ncbi:MAG TPA: efflux RND transporter periplasmic adaptor subunit [Ohtaekwangia sp.]
MQKLPYSAIVIRTLSVLALAAASNVVFVACTTQAENLKQETAPAFQGIPVDAAITATGLIKEELEVTGTLLANQTVDIVSELTRRIVKVNVKEGSHVREGDVLFVLDDADLQAQLERFRQQEKLAELNEKRLRDLLEKEAVSQQDYDETATNLKVLQAQIRELQVTVSKTRITAPFNGQIGMINTHPGAIVSVNTVLTDIEDNSVIKVEFSVPEKYTNVIKLGSTQNFTISSDHKVYTTKIVARSASLSQETRTLLVRGLTENRDGKLLPGLSARLVLSLGDDNKVVSIPSQSLIPSTGGYSVFVSRNQKAEHVAVEIGQRSAGAVEIVKGLQPGDTVVTTNQLRLAPGTPVQLVTIN